MERAAVVQVGSGPRSMVDFAQRQARSDLRWNLLNSAPKTGRNHEYSHRHSAVTVGPEGLAFRDNPLRPGASSWGRGRQRVGLGGQSFGSILALVVHDRKM